ncbi:MAG: PilT/PilU family type 4a pilus ATPase, partial [Nitrospirae bacterium]|nr:PilT/PilU family type 4a pilus ATPase [Nitrospirota bacterium]
KRLPLPNVTSAQMIEFANEILSREQKETFARAKEIDFAVSLPDIGRFRINMYRQRSSISLSARFVIEKIPSISELGLPEWIADFAMKQQGLILITGPTGHGKTTTVSAIIDIINSNRGCNILTLEDPIEFLHRHKRSNINQREIGVDTDSFEEGLKHIFRQDPDVLVISELRDPRSVEIALSAAETGHLVISTVHAEHTIAAIEKILDTLSKDQQNQARLQFADSFLLVFSQTLVPKKGGGGRVLAYEKIVQSPRIRNFIREAKALNIKSLMQVAPGDVVSVEQNLAKLFLNGEITFEDGLKFSDNSAYYHELVKSQPSN